MKTLAVKLEDELHAQLTALAQLEGIPVIEAIRRAIVAEVTRLGSDQTLLAKAEALLADIDREAASRRDAISALLGSTEAGGPASPAAKKPRGREAETTG